MSAVEEAVRVGDTPGTTAAGEVGVVGPVRRGGGSMRGGSGGDGEVTGAIESVSIGCCLGLKC